MRRVLEYKTPRSCLRFSALIDTDNNLYIGTSASELLHYVCLPPDTDDDDTTEPTYILASRLQPSIQPNNPPSEDSKGVQQILLLPGSGKACLLCDGVVTFYSLPELSPAFATRAVQGCKWIGAVDEDLDINTDVDHVILVAVASRILLVKVGEDLKKLRQIDVPGIRQAARRDTIACVADQNSYALLEVEQQQKIPLFPISSLGETDNSRIGKVEDVPTESSPLPSRSSSLAHRAPNSNEMKGHDRSASLGNFVSSIGRRQNSPRPVSQDMAGMRTPESNTDARSPSKGLSPERRESQSTIQDRDASPSPAQKQKPLPSPPKPQAILKPHVLSPTPTEFLLTTGTREDESGVGMFVNVDGDVVRGTLNFERYPEAIILDDANSDLSVGNAPSGDMEGYVLAVIGRYEGNTLRKGLEIQRWDTDIGEKSWLPIPFSESVKASISLRRTLSPSDHVFSTVGDILRLVRLREPGASPRQPDTQEEISDPRTKVSLERVEKEKDLFEGQISSTSRDALPSDWESKRNAEEAAFARRFGNFQSRAMLSLKDVVWRVVKNPLALQLEASLEGSFNSSGDLDVSRLISLLGSIRDREAKTESEFLSLEYVRRKASLLMFQSILQRTKQGHAVDDGQLRATELALVEGGLDPRVILLLVPLLSDDVLQGPQGLWINQGLAEVAESARSSTANSDHELTIGLYMMIRRYLTAWQGKEGFGSIADVDLVSETVDAALLHVLLHIDATLPDGSPASSSVRTKLNNIVDNWKGSFSRAVTLLEDYKRLFVLSRLYQSRKLSKDVLGTWKRICLGEQDMGGELSPPAAEKHIRSYITRIHDRPLVEDYALWLANRNPPLAIQALTDDSARVKFAPSELIPLLKSRAPKCVQQYLEYLVFSKSLYQYADDLVSYYLDTVLSILESSEEARSSLAQSYSTYRALRPPKPTYVNFITDNAPSESWWQSRLRLLQLLGGGNFASSSSQPQGDLQYSIPSVLARLAPFSQYLVSESIILDARQGRHEEALRLLTHGLGDYDTAIRYCYFGSPSSSSSSSSTPIPSSSLPTFLQQKALFSHLLSSFLEIEDLESRLERTSDLLAKFSKWFDPLDVLEQIPEHWSIELLEGFLTSVMRRLEAERVESGVVKGLAASLNLKMQVQWIEGCEKIGPSRIGQDGDGGRDDGEGGRGGDANRNDGTDEEESEEEFGEIQLPLRGREDIVVS